MSSPLPSAPADAGEADGPCGGRGRAGWGWWIALPLVLVTGFVMLAVAAWLASGGAAPAAPPGAPYPFFWPLFPFGFFLVVFAGFLVLRFVLWGAFWGGGRTGYGAAGPRQILRQRYARGEISVDQLRQMLRDLDEVG
jgi:uncharacterized membrane protein